MELQYVMMVVLVAALSGTGPVCSQSNSRGRSGGQRPHNPEGRGEEGHSHNVGQNPGCQPDPNEGGGTPGGVTPGPFVPTRVVLLVLQERCFEWMRRSRPLPPYCNQVQTGATQKLPDTTVCTYYREYSRTVSDEDRRRDHDEVRKKHGPW